MTSHDAMNPVPPVTHTPFSLSISDHFLSLILSSFSTYLPFSVTHFLSLLESRIFFFSPFLSHRLHVNLQCQIVLYTYWLPFFSMEKVLFLLHYLYCLDSVSVSFFIEKYSSFSNIFIAWILFLSLSLPNVIFVFLI